MSNMNDKPEFEDIWIAADGGSYGILIVGFRDDGDVLCRDLRTGTIRDIDPFKLSYRYKKIGSIRGS